MSFGVKYQHTNGQLEHLVFEEVFLNVLIRKLGKQPVCNQLKIFGVKGKEEGERAMFRLAGAIMDN